MCFRGVAPGNKSIGEIRCDKSIINIYKNTKWYIIYDIKYMIKWYDKIYDKMVYNI